MSASIAERVAAGAAWLDEKRPGWVDHMDLGRLDLHSPCNCILGQEFGNYFDAELVVTGTDDKFGLYSNDESFAVALGFSDHTYDFRVRGANMAMLDAEWRRLITERRRAVKAAKP